MPINSGMMTSLKHDYETPQDLFNNLNNRFGFVIDAAASHNNAKTKRYYTEEEDGLAQEWDEKTWVNPPYGRQIGKWIKKAYSESVRHDVLVTMLLPARTDTRWFHNYVMRAGEVWFITGRIRFVGTEHPAPFPSMLVFFFGSHKPVDGRPPIFSCTKTGGLIIGEHEK